MRDDSLVDLLTSDVKVHNAQTIPDEAMKKPAIHCLLAFSLMLAGCHIRGGEPSQSELFSGLEDQLEHANDRGGIKVNMGNAGAFQTIQLDFKLHQLVKNNCTGSQYTYTCKVTVQVSSPVINNDPEELDLDVIIFDGPGGWRVIDWTMTDRRLID